MPADQAADLFIAGITYAARAANMADAAAVLRLPLDASAPEGAKPLAETIAATKAAVDATKAIDGKLAGAPPAEITALLALADAARIAAVQEPVPTARKAALDAVGATAKAAQAAMVGATVQAAQQATALLPATLPGSVKAAAQNIADAALHNAADSAALAIAALAAQKAAYGETVPTAVTDAVNTAATDAAARADALALLLSKAPRPVDLKLITHAASVVSSASDAARGSPDAATAKAAFEAAANLASAIDAALADATMRFETHSIRASADGKEALGHLAAADAASARADAVLLLGSEAEVLGAAAADIKAVADTMTEISVYRLETNLDTRASVPAKVEANAKNGGAALAPQIRDEIDAKASQLETQAQGKRTDPNQTGLSATASTKTLDAAQKQKRRDTGDAIATLDATEETAAITATQTTAGALRDDLAQTLVDLAAIDFTTQATDGARLLDLARKQSDQL